MLKAPISMPIVWVSNCFGFGPLNVSLEGIRVSQKIIPHSPVAILFNIKQITPYIPFFISCNIDWYLKVLEMVQQIFNMKQKSFKHI